MDTSTRTAAPPWQQPLQLEEHRTGLLSSQDAPWPRIAAEYHIASPYRGTLQVNDRPCVVAFVGLPVDVLWRVGGRDQPVRYQRGDFALLPAHFSARASWDRTAEFVAVSLDDGLLPETLNGESEQLALVLEPLFKSSDPLIHELMFVLRDEMESGYLGGSTYGRALGLMLAFQLMKRHLATRPRQPRHRRGLSRAQLAVVDQFILERIDQPVSVPAMAESCGLSVHYFAVLFKAATGRSPHRYLIERRVEHARELLARGGESLSEVALSCGFSHQSHLSKWFRDLTGITPERFRRLSVESD